MKFKRFYPVFMMLSIVCVTGGYADDTGALFSISGRAAGPGYYEFSMSGRIPDGSTELRVYTEPYAEPLCSILSPAAALEEAISFLEQPSRATIHPLDPVFDTSVILPFETGTVTGFSLYEARYENGMRSERLLVTVYTRPDEEFSFEFEPDGIGCLSRGKCGNGSWFWGPYCEPCIFTVFCRGDTGYIVCGSMLEPPM